MYYDPNTGFCEYQCPNDMLRDQIAGKCVNSCENGTILLTGYNICTITCRKSYNNYTSDPTKQYIDKLIRQCVAEN